MTEWKTKRRTDNQRFKDILDVAARVFRKKGYHHANMSDIAKEVGLQKGSLYHYISSKEELLYEIVMYSLDLYIKPLSEILTSNEKSDISLKKAIIAHMHPMDLQFDMVYVFINERHNLSDKYRVEADRQTEIYRKMWLDILEKGKMEGIFNPALNSKITWLSIIGTCNWTLRWYDTKGKYTTIQLGEIYAQNILNGIKKP